MKAHPSNQVRSWLATRRFQELPIKRSVEIWAAQDKERVKKLVAEAPLDEMTARAVKEYAEKKKQKDTARKNRLQIMVKGEIDRRKQSIYFHEETLAEVRAEAVRLDRNVSWVLQQAWRFAAEQMKRFPGFEGEQK